MSKDSSGKQIKRIQKYIKKWKWIVTELGWKFNVMYHEETRDMPRDVPGGSIACVESDFNYLSATINFDLSIVKMVNDCDLQGHILHELTHILVDGLTQDKTLEEYTVTSISRIIHRMGM